MLRTRKISSRDCAFSTAAFVGALISLGFMSDAGAATTVNPCPMGFGYYCSHVTDQVADNGNGTWTYNFTVYNDSFAYAGTEPRIRDWELPYFRDAGITQISSPGLGGWNFAIEKIGVANPATGWDGIAAWQDSSDPWYQGANSPFSTVTEVLHWFTMDFGAAIQPVNGLSGVNWLSGFGFVADYGPTAAPYQASWVELPTRTGDPQFPGAGLPDSPALRGNAIPEPGTLALLGLGLAGLAGLRRTRRESAV